jgi:hypothetical protein
MVTNQRRPRARSRSGGLASAYLTR